MQPVYLETSSLGQIFQSQPQKQLYINFQKLTNLDKFSQKLIHLETGLFDTIFVVRFDFNFIKNSNSLIFTEIKLYFEKETGLSQNWFTSASYYTQLQINLDQYFKKSIYLHPKPEPIHLS